MFLVLVTFTTCKEEGDVIFHDSFEYYDVGFAPRGPWTIDGQGIIRVDSARSHSGELSVYFESNEGFDNRAFIKLIGNPLFPFVYNRISGSFYIWLDEASPDGIHWTMVQAGGSVSGKGYKSEVRYGGQHHKQLMANYDTQGKNTDCWHHSTTAMPERQWVKVGWLFDGTNETMKFWLNDELVKDLIVIKKGQGCLGNDLGGKWVFPVFEELMIGWVDYQTGGGTRRFWIDDVMLYH
ncbi:MAG: hypothetical protein ABJH72_03390 [Reichenbachiella sp.]|uniref:hypothetical protein n=1 Tax=Reichenbachiella sp. TaxID=2184521 RepID=UPI003267E4CB